MGRPWEKWPAGVEGDVRQLLSDPDNAINEIANAYDLSWYSVNEYAEHTNAPSRSRKPQTGRTKRAITSDALDKELASLREQRAELDRRMEALREQRDEMSIHFTRDGEYVTAHGITAIGGFVATMHEWLNWLNHEGARKLRDFITHELKKGPQ